MKKAILILLILLLITPVFAVELSTGTTQTKDTSIYLDNGLVQFTDKNTGLSISTTTLIDDKTFTPTFTSSGDVLTWQSADGKFEYEYQGKSLKETITLASDKKIAFTVNTLGSDSKIIPWDNGQWKIVSIKSGDTMNGIILEKPFGIDAKGNRIEMNYVYKDSVFTLDYNRTITKYEYKETTIPPSGKNLTSTIGYILTAVYSVITYPLIIDPTWTSAGGCWTTTDGAYTIVMWNATGTTSWTPPPGVTAVRALIVAGGAGGGWGGGANGNAGGGGGAGGMRDVAVHAVSGTETIVVGAKGTGGTTAAATTSGTASSMTSGGGASAETTTVGGGKGGEGYARNNPGTGGSGGGGGGYILAQSGAAGTAGEGNAGGSASVSAPGYGAGAGGGNGWIGYPGSATAGGVGGDAGHSDITGVDTAYAGGGAGASLSVTAAAPGGNWSGIKVGGDGGYSSSRTGKDAVANTGSGGGGAMYDAAGQSGGNGSDGIVIIKYLTPGGVPNNILNLNNSTTNCNDITFTWTNETNGNYGYLYTMKNNVFYANLSNTTNTLTWSLLTENTEYNLSTKAYSVGGSPNLSWVNKTVKTLFCPVGPPPDPIPNPNIPVCHTQNFFFWNQTSYQIPGYRILNNYPELDSVRYITTSVSSATGSKIIGNFTTAAFTETKTMAPGPWRFRSYFYVSSAVGDTRVEYSVFNRSSTGVETHLWYGTAITGDINNLATAEQLLTYARRNSTTFYAGDRLVIKVNASTTSVTSRDIYMGLAGNVYASMVQNGWWICNESTGTATPTPDYVWSPEINPTTDIKTDYVALLYQWWWLPALILIMIYLFGRR